MVIRGMKKSQNYADFVNANLSFATKYFSKELIAKNVLFSSNA
jgi:hypothetical protein